MVFSVPGLVNSSSRGPSLHHEDETSVDTLAVICEWTECVPSWR